MAAPRNIPGFYQAFDIKEGDGMYLTPEQRVVLW
jgi:endothelin-converting enzyme/putative endopeptidase